jgi:hypothetical protein
MKNMSALFWGLFFLVIGGLFLLNNLNIFDVNWDTVWRLWPLILVFWGLSIVVGKQRPPAWAVVLMILLVVFMIMAAFTSSWFNREFDVSWNNSRELNKQTFEESYSPAMERATFRLQSGAGKFYIRDTTNQLVRATTEVSFGKYDLRKELSDNTAYVTLDFEGRSRHINFGGMRNRADVQLNVQPTWDITVEVGAATVNFDLSPYKVDQLRVSAGASSMKFRLGDRAEETRVKIETGASSTSVEVPQSVGCELRLATTLSGKQIRGLEKVSSNRYQTADFESAKKKIYIDVEAGVSQIRVNRY